MVIFNSYVKLPEGIIGVNMYIYIQCGAPKIAKLVHITPITMVYGTYNYSYWANLNQLITGGPHIVYLYICI